MRVYIKWYVLIITLLISFQAVAQGGWKQVRLSGSMGIYLEDYKRFGEPRRRPPHTARLYLRPSLSFFGLKTGINLDLFLSTEQRYVAQSLNTVGITPSWSWGGLSLGDFYPSFSSFTLNNIRVRGVGMKFTPGILRFSVAAGETQKASSKKGAEAYQRMLYALHLGVGKTSSSYLDVNFVKSVDRTSSLAQNQDLKITPKENMVASVAGRLRLWKNHILLSSEIAACIHTRDRQSVVFEEERIPSFVTAIFQPRLSTRIDYAYFTEAQLQLRPVSLSGGVKYVGPGYTTLGVSSLFNDVKEVHTNGMLRLFRNRLMFRSAYASQWDNLLGQKRFTTQRQRLSFNLTMLPVKALNTNFGLLVTNMDNRAPTDSLRVNFYSISANGSVGLTFPKTFFIKSARAAGSYMLSENSNSSFRYQRLETHQLSGSLQIGSIFSFVLTPTASVIHTRTGLGAWKWILSLGGAVTRVRSKRLSFSLSGSFNARGSTESYRGDLRVGYRVTKTGTISFNMRAANYLSDMPSVKSYRELMTSLSYNQRF